jgi:hypothetical protein
MTMNAKLKKSAVTLTITIIFFSLTQANIRIVSSNDTARKIDMFTQKIPFNGNGINQSSDAFQPQELVILYALVSYNEYPIANNLVAFQVNNPANVFHNITIVGVSSTNQSGIAQFSFRIPWPFENPEQIIFGGWFAIATIDIAEQVVIDTLTFQVGWIIEITSITTLNAKLELQTKYLGGDVIVFNLTVENIALTLKSAAIIIDAQDAASYPILHTEMDNLVFQHGENHVCAPSQISTAAAIGEATISAVAYTALPKIGGIPYSPAALSTFEIVRPPVKQYYLTVRTNPYKITAISGEGWYSEGTNVLLAAPEYVSVSTGVRYKFGHWDVDGISQGLSIYEITVHMDTNHTASANYITRYLVTFNQTGLDPSASRTVVTINGLPKTFSGLPYTLWIGNGTVVTYSYSTIVSSSVSGKRFNLLDVSGPDSPITVTGQVTVTGNYKTQYYLTVISPYGTPGGEGWYDSGVTAYATLSTGIVDHRNGTRRAFISWSGDTLGTKYVQSNPILMDAPKAAVANWKTQCEVTFAQSGLDSSVSDAFMTVDGVSKTFGELPYIIWVDAGTVITYSYRNVSSTTLGKRFILIDVTDLPSPIVVTSPVKVTGNYKTQCYLTVRTDPPGILMIPGEGWHNQCENVTLTASPVKGYDFEYWDVDEVPQSIGVDTVTVHMNSPHIVTVHYSVSAKVWYVPDWFCWLLLLLLLLVLFLLIIWLYRRKRRKKAEEAFYSGWTAWYYGYDLRGEIYRS